MRAETTIWFVLCPLASCLHNKENAKHKLSSAANDQQIILFSPSKLLNKNTIALLLALRRKLAVCASIGGWLGIGRWPMAIPTMAVI